MPVCWVHKIWILSGERERERESELVILHVMIACAVYMVVISNFDQNWKSGRCLTLVYYDYRCSLDVTSCIFFSCVLCGRHHMVLSWISKSSSPLCPLVRNVFGNLATYRSMLRAYEVYALQSTVSERRKIEYTCTGDAANEGNGRGIT